jgi:hypothetical protein
VVLIAPRREADALRFVDRFAELVPELA